MIQIGRFKSFAVAAFSLLLTLFSYTSFAQNEHGEHLQSEDAGHERSDAKGGEGDKKGGFNANEVIFGHVLDAHQFHFFSWTGSDGHQHHASLPLPVLLYEPGRGV